MAEQTFAGPAPAPALVFAERESSEFLKQLYGHNEDFLEVPYIPPSLAGAFEGGYVFSGLRGFPHSHVSVRVLPGNSDSESGATHSESISSFPMHHRIRTRACRGGS